MSSKWILGCVLLVLTSLFVLPPVTLASNDDWSMFRQNPNHTGALTDNGEMNSGKLLWNYTTNSPIYSSPAVSGNCVYVGSRDHNIYCFNEYTGEKLWNFSTGSEVIASPAVSGGCLYVGSNDGWFYCLNASTGVPIWIEWLGWNANSNPAVWGGCVFVGSGNHDVVCFNATNGTEIWRYPTSDWVLSSPAIADGILYIACNDFYVHAVNASTGAGIWKTPTGSADSSPAVYNGCVYVGSYGGYLFSLDAQNGSVRWSYRTADSVVSSPALADGCVYFGSQDNSVYCLNAVTGEKIWETKTGFWVCSSPTVAGGCVYVGSEDYTIYCLNASNGEKLWAYATDNQVVSSPAVADDKLFVGSFDNNLYAFTLYNSISEPVIVKSSFPLSWTTIVFDLIALIVAAVMVFLVANYVRSVWQTKKIPSLSLQPSDNRSSILRHPDVLALIVIFGFAVVYYANLGSGVLWAADEQAYSQIAYYMIKSGDFLNLHAYGYLAIWTGKPPLLMWLISLSYQVFGVTNFAARFFNPIFGVLALLFVYYLGKKLFNSAVGFLSVIVLGTFSTFYLFATHAMTDVLLTCLILVSLYFFVLSQDGKAATWYAPLSGVFFGLAFLTKQSGAILIPIILIIYLILTQRSLKSIITKRFAVFLGTALFVVAPWLIYMTFSYGYDFWNCYFLYSTLTRLSSPIEGHVHGYLYYLNYLSTSETLLWVVLLPVAIILCGYFAFKRSKADILLVTWIAVVLSVFTLAQTKIYYYILPVYPAFALAIANMLYQLYQKIARRHQISN